MHFRIISIHNKSQAWAKEALAQYVKQLGPAHSINFIDIACKHPQNATTEQIQLNESKSILNKLNYDALTIAWDGRRGKKISSEGLAEFFLVLSSSHQVWIS